METEENLKIFFKSWVLSGNTVCIELSDGIHFPSAAEIVRVEFKGLSSINGITINNKPSDSLPSIHFNRFPCSLKLELQMPTESLPHPILNLIAISDSKIFTLQKLPEYNQIIIDGKDWYPLILEDLHEIKDLLHKMTISDLGHITLKQALDLLKIESPIISISSVSTTIKTPGLKKYDTSEALNLLSENGFLAKLYPYQDRGFSWLKSISEEGLGCILADEMGLGKTLQVITVLSYFKILWKLPALIIAPATLLENWRREFAHFSPEISVHINVGAGRIGFPSQLKQFDVIVCSYDTAVRDQGLLGMLNWSFIVLDEAQAIKNPDTRRAIAVKGLKSKVAIAVTGTPVENSLSDLWSIMDFSCPGLLGTREVFEKNYSNDESGAKKLEVLVSPLMLRRRVADVAKDLPEKIIIPQPIDMTNDEISNYELIRQNTLEEYGGSATLVSLLRLRQYCTHPLILEQEPVKSASSILNSSKYVRLTEILEEIVLNHQKVIVFTSFTKMSDILCADIPVRFGIPSWNIDGRTPVESRQKVVDQFSEVNGSAILVLNPRAAGTGLNITAANHVIHYTLEWNPAVEDQATARAFRRGQKLPVTVHRLFYPNTVEEVINDRLDRKRQLAETAVVGTEAPEIEAADLARALKLSPLTNPEGVNQ